MESEIYEACRHGDIDLVQVLIQTSPHDTDLNHLELNGSTALHIACSKGFTDIIRLLLNDHRVDRHQTNKDGRTAYEVASTEEIRQLFHRPQDYNNPFCTDENTSSPIELIHNKDDSNPRYIDTYPTAAPILTECYYEVLDANRNAFLSIVDWCKSLFGYDPHQKRFDKWLKDLQFHVERCLIDEYLERHCEPNYTSYSKAYKCIKAYEKTRNIEHLLRLYTLDTCICQYFAQNSDRTNYLYAPILFNLLSMEERAYKDKKPCFRGLTMKQNEFAKYQRALHCKESLIKINTLCSTSLKQSVAEVFADGSKTKDTVNVIIRFEFVQPCCTALILFSCPPRLRCVSYFEDEQEVLILPGTIFSVKDIQEDDQTQLKTIYLEHYNTDEEKAEMHQERLKSYIDTFILDD